MLKSMTTSSPSPLNSRMHTTCAPASQVQARDSGRRYKKLCVEIIADTEWRQGYGGQRGSSQSVDTTYTQDGTPAFLQSSGFAPNINQMEDLLTEW